jgi:hypothetical protein
VAVERTFRVPRVWLPEDSVDAVFPDGCEVFRAPEERLPGGPCCSHLECEVFQAPQERPPDFLVQHRNVNILSVYDLNEAD